MFFTPHLYIRFFTKQIHSFHFFGVLGFVLGTVLGCIVCYFTKLSIPVILLMSLTGAATFFLLAFGAKIITGKEKIVYYHHEIAILVFSSLILWLTGRPVLQYLDVTLLGIATFLAFGRIGCFSVGCCHGKPAEKGVVYGHEHVKKGFTWYYEGIPLLPVQLIESLFVFILIITGTVFLLSHSLPGTFLILYTVVYGAFRFSIEFSRGDAERPYYKGLSEAQWTTIALIAISAVLSFAGVLPFYSWHIIISLIVFASSVIIVLTNKTQHDFLKPVHVKQIAHALHKLKNHSRSSVYVESTKLELNLSGGQLSQHDELITHYTVSCNQPGQLNKKIVNKLANLIRQIQYHKGCVEILQEKNGVFHIVFSTISKSSTPPPHSPIPF